jgi:adenosylcobinamide kinase/adenosylcobinamide-phosphate guanylyltransferase
MLPKRTLVLGGAASGKSAWAEELTKRYEKSMIYLATGQIFDDEMAQKVEIHQARRKSGWTTVEAPLDLGPTLAQLRADQVVLIDCATMWLSNHLMAQSDLAAAQAALLRGLETCAAATIIVSNEVGHGVVPDNALARQFREAQGRLNIALAAQADLAVLVTAGLPLALKGHLP